MKLMEILECGCYKDGGCALTKKEANCIYYEKCMSGYKPPKLVIDGDEEYITDLI